MHGVNNGTGPSGVGVWGSHAGGGYGVYATSVTGIGVVAEGSTAVRATGSATGVLGTGRTGVKGSALGGSSLDTGVVGEASPDATRFGVGVEGQAGYIGVNGKAAQAGGAGVWGTGGIGVRGTGSGPSGIGVYGQGSQYAGQFAGNVHVSGTLSKTAGSFRIDHPLDPEQQWLSHSFVESPDMMNVYNGNVELDADGAATVELPAYFAALNRDLRYQLTAIGGAAPDLHVAAEVADNRFTIAGGRAGLKVSWQVTGIRQDDYARAHPILVEAPMSAEERGTRAFG